jgi:hypothetical protein
MEIVTKGNRVAFLMYLVATPANSDLSLLQQHHEDDQQVPRSINEVHLPLRRFIDRRHLRQESQNAVNWSQGEFQSSLNFPPSADRQLHRSYLY